MTNNSDKKQIEIKSLRERILLKQEYLDKTTDKITQIEYTPYNGNEKYDATWVRWHSVFPENAAETVIAEIKVRNYPMESYNSWLIEKDKYDFLMSQKHCKILYICIHPTGIQEWDLRQVPEPKWIESVLPRNNQDNTEKIKVNGDLMSSDAHSLKTKIDIHKALDQAQKIWEQRNA